MVAALLLAVLALGMNVGTAAAHGGHAHGISTSSSTTIAAVQDREPAPEARAASMHSVAVVTSGDVAHKPIGASSKSDCCCGGVMCHAGMTFAQDTLSVPFHTGARVVAVPASGHPQSNGSGLERPPRTV